MESEGLLLVHDRVLPSVNALIAGEPVRVVVVPSLANLIYNALGTIEDQVACKLRQQARVTLVAPRLWADLVSVPAARSNHGNSRDCPSTQRVCSIGGVVIASRDPRHPRIEVDGKRLEERLLVSGMRSTPTVAGHVKASSPGAVEEGPRSERSAALGQSAQARFEEIVDRWNPTRGCSVANADYQGLRLASFLCQARGDSKWLQRSL